MVKRAPEDTTLVLNPGLISGQLTVETPANLGGAWIQGRCTIGAFTFFQGGCQVADADIGRYCSIAGEVLIGTQLPKMSYLTSHPVASDPSGVSAGFAGLEAYRRVGTTGLANVEYTTGRVTIGHDVWIGPRCIIMAGVTIEPGAVILPGSVVSSDVPAFAVAGGAPARVIRYRLSEEHRWRALAAKWWDYDLGGLPARDYSDLTGFFDALSAAVYNGAVKLLEPTTVTLPAA